MPECLERDSQKSVYKKMFPGKKKDRRTALKERFSFVNVKHLVYKVPVENTFQNLCHIEYGA